MKSLRVLFSLLALLLTVNVCLYASVEESTQDIKTTGEKISHVNQHQEQHIESHDEHSGHGTDMSPLFFIVMALFIGIATHHLLRKSSLPYTVTLLILGILMGVLQRVGVIPLESLISDSVAWAGSIDPHLMLYIFLPLLIFEAAFAMDVHTFKKSFVNAFFLAVPGIIIALGLTAVIAMGIKNTGLGLENWTWTVALIFGTLISANDPVAVVALLKELGTSKKLSTLVESESLLNDGTAIVIFMVLFAMLTGGETSSAGEVVGKFLIVALGGTALGLIIGYIVNAWLKKVFNDPLFEITIIISAAYLTFFLAEHLFKVSGVLGLVAFGLMMAGVGRTRISPQVNHFLHEFWELASFIANTLIFIIVGVVIAQKTVFTGKDFIILGIIYIAIMLIRGGVISLFYPMMKNIGYGMSKKDGIVLCWGSLRGAIGLALALIIAGAESIPEDIRNQILFLTAGIVAITSLLNATTTKNVVNSLGLTKISSAKAALLKSNNKFIRQSSDNALQKIKDDRYMKNADWKLVSDFLPSEDTITFDDVVQVEAIAESRKRLLHKEKSSYWKQFEEGMLGREAVQTLSSSIDNLLDSDGNISLSHRKDLENLWRTPKFLDKLQYIPLIRLWAKNIFFEKFATSYDCARGFVNAQDDMLKLVKSIALSADEDGLKLTDKDFELLESEVYENRIEGLTFIRNLREAFPDICRGIETRQAIRSVLNHQQQTVKKLLNQRRIEPDEAEKMNEDIEEKMQQIMEKPPKTYERIDSKSLKKVKLFKDIPLQVIDEIADQFQQRVYSVGEELVKNNRSGDDIFIILSGSVKVEIDGKLINILPAGNVIGEMSMLTGIPRTATITAESPVTALKLSASMIEMLVKDHSIIEERLWEMAAKRFAYNIIDKLDEFKNLTKEEIKDKLSNAKLESYKTNDELEVSDGINILLEGMLIKDEDNSKTLSNPGLLVKGKYKFLKDSKLYKV